MPNNKIDFNLLVYETCCLGCEHEKRCHQSCETCEEYEEVYSRLWEEMNGSE